jgi:hypothetical protein
MSHSAINIQCEPSPELCDYLGTKPAPGQPTGITDEAGTLITDEAGNILVNEQ